MKKLRALRSPYVLGAFGLTFLSLISSAFGNIDLSGVLENIYIQENRTDTLQFNFKQDIQFSGLESQSTVQGQAFFQRPKKLRIVKKIPIEQTTISDGKKMWIYTPSYKQVWEGKWEGWLKGVSLPKGLVPFGNFVEDLKNNFDLTLDKTTSTPVSLYILKAVPKENPAEFTLDFLISAENWMPIQTTYHSETATVVTTMTDMVINGPVDAKIFTFKSPKGTEVLKIN